MEIVNVVFYIPVFFFAAILISFILLRLEMEDIIYDQKYIKDIRRKWFS